MRERERREREKDYIKCTKYIVTKKIRIYVII